MLIKQIDLEKKIISLLRETTGKLKAETLAEKCHVSTCRVYTAIRSIKQGVKDRLPIGVHSLRAGYVLSEFASKTDDVQLFRRLNGATASAFITANAAAPHVRKRWNSVEDKRTYELIMKPFNDVSGRVSMDRGMQILLQKSKS